jgi:hypothetical protein
MRYPFAYVDSPDSVRPAIDALDIAFSCMPSSGETMAQRALGR